MEHHPLSAPEARGGSGVRFGLLVAVLAVVPGALAGSLLAVIVGLVLALLLIVYHRRSVVGPLAQVSLALERYQTGDEKARAQESGELAELAARINTVLDQGGDVERLQLQQDEARARIQRLLRQMSGVANGDLGAEADIRDGDLAPVAAAFNSVVRELRSIVASVTTTTDAVGSASQEIALASSTLTSLSDTQAHRMVETTTVLDEVTGSIQQVSERARQTTDVSSQAIEDARTGSAAVQETAQVMERLQREIEDATRIVARLGDSSQEIGAIVQFIAQIARQTNTLALNASIQAARAGEHGRGFAVVADEVRTLAERSSNATKQIGALVTTIQADTAEAVVAMDTSSREVTAGVRIAGEAGTAIEKVDVIVGRLGALTENIAQASESQARAVSQVTQAMHEMTTEAESATSSNQRAAASVVSLSDLAERLRQSVANFSQVRQPGSAWAGDGDD